MSDPRTNLHRCICGRQNEWDEECICEKMKDDELWVSISILGSCKWLSFDTKDEKTLFTLKVINNVKAIDMLNNFSPEISIHPKTYTIVPKSIKNAIAILNQI